MAQRHIILTLRYRDPAAAIAFLKRAFDFREHAVHKEAGEIVHAELVLGGSMIMLGSASDSEFGKLQGIPEEFGGRVTASPYIVVKDVDALHAQALEAGAKIAMPLSDKDYGSREFSCFDPEGHLWNFGTYDPFNPRGDGE